MNRRLTIAVVLALTSITTIALAQRYASKAQTHSTVNPSPSTNPQNKANAVLSIDRSKKPELVSNAISNNALQQTTATVTEEIPGTIDGKKNPEKIPDRTAYLAIFRAVSTQNDDTSQKYVRAYLSQMLGECLTCSDSKLSKLEYEKAKKERNDDVLALSQVVKDFHLNIAELDSKVKKLKDDNWPIPSAYVMSQLTEHQKQKETIVDSLTASLPTKLSKNGMKALKNYVQLRVKNQIKMIPSPMGPPGSPEWERGKRVIKHH